MQVIKKLRLFVVIYFLFLPMESMSYLGLGIIIGEPTGLSVKFDLGHSNMIHGALNYSFDSKNSVYLHGDYLWRNHGIISADDLAVYYGPGVKVKFSGDGGKGKGGSTKVAIRFPVGMNYEFPSAPFDLFAELVPVLNIIDHVDLDLKIAIGGRFLFR